MIASAKIFQMMHHNIQSLKYVPYELLPGGLIRLQSDLKVDVGVWSEFLKSMTQFNVLTNSEVREEYVHRIEKKTIIGHHANL